MVGTLLLRVAADMLTLALTEGWPWWGKALFAALIVIGIVVIVKAVLARL